MDQPKCDVLVVEDDPDVSLFLERAFEKAGLVGPICRVPDGEQAISYFKGEGVYADRDRYPVPTLVLLSLRLPKKSGLEVLAWFRQQPGIGGIPVVILTGAASPDDINDAYAAGANSVLITPFGFEPLVEIVRAIRQYWLIINQGPFPPKHERKG